MSGHLNHRPGLARDPAALAMARALLPAIRDRIVADPVDLSRAYALDDERLAALVAVQVAEMDLVGVTERLAIAVEAGLDISVLGTAEGEPSSALLPEATRKLAAGIGDEALSLTAAPAWRRVVCEDYPCGSVVRAHRLSAENGSEGSQVVLPGTYGFVVDVDDGATLKVLWLADALSGAVVLGGDIVEAIASGLDLLPVEHHEGLRAQAAAVGKTQRDRIINVFSIPYGGDNEVENRRAHIIACMHGRTPAEIARR